MRALVGFLGPRLFRALVALWLVSTVVFVVMRLSGDPVPLLVPPDAPRSEYERVAKDLGLDRPLPVQYAVFLGNVLRGDFGRSIHFRQPAWGVVMGYVPATAELALAAFGLALRGGRAGRPALRRQAQLPDSTTSRWAWPSSASRRPRSSSASCSSCCSRSRPTGFRPRAAAAGSIWSSPR